MGVHSVGPVLTGPALVHWNSMLQTFSYKSSVCWSHSMYPDVLNVTHHSLLRFVVTFFFLFAYSSSDFILIILVFWYHFYFSGEENRVVLGQNRNNSGVTDVTMYHYRAFRPARSSITHVQILVIFWVMGKQTALENLLVLVCPNYLSK